MISAANVLLVLGAGASKPYGLPTGPELVERVLAIDPHDPTDRFVAATDVLRSDLPVEHIEHFQRELAAAQFDSIEFFLERRPEFTRIGKLVMAHALLRAERPKRLLRPREDGWYSYFLNHVLDPEAGGLDRVRENRLGVVSFNYDRSFEAFLVSALQARYRVAWQQAWDVVQAIPVVHAHGQLGALAEQSGAAGLRYGAAPDAASWALAAAGIRVVHENPAADAEVFGRVHELVAGAERIVILGFAYSRTNLERLRLELMSPSCYLYGTTFGMTASEERANIVGPLEPLLASRPHKFANVDVLDFIRGQRHLFY